METTKLFDLFDQEVAQVVAKAKSNATTYEEALSWLIVYARSEKKRFTGRTTIPREMLIKEYARDVYFAAEDQLKKEARRLPFAKI